MLTAVDNALILRNLELLARRGREIWLRVPVVPGLTDAPEALARTGRLARDLGIARIHLRPYNAAAEGKRRRLAPDGDQLDLRPPTFLLVLVLAVPGLAVDLCGSTYDTKVYVYDADLQLMACNDDFYHDDVCGMYVSRLEQVDLEAGVEYYLMIAGWATWGTYMYELGPQDCEQVGMLQEAHVLSMSGATLSITGEPGSTVWLWVGPDSFESPTNDYPDEYTYMLSIPQVVAARPHSWSAVTGLFE